MVVLERLLNDNTTLVMGSAVMALEEVRSCCKRFVADLQCCRVNTNRVEFTKSMNRVEFTKNTNRVKKGAIKNS